LLSLESTTLSLANPQKGHFMALGFQLLSCHSDTRRQAKRRRNEEESIALNDAEIVTVEGAPNRPEEALPVFREAPGSADQGIKRGAPTPCGESARFSPFPPGDGGREVCDPATMARVKDLLRRCRTRRSHLSYLCQELVKSRRARRDSHVKRDALRNPPALTPLL
jgi:hypothetical protein